MFFEEVDAGFLQRNSYFHIIFFQYKFIRGWEKIFDNSQMPHRFFSMFYFALHIFFFLFSKSLHSSHSSVTFFMEVLWQAYINIAI